jgi:mRNA-degrading endonuclease toxin of MazEF toxin-antitoxin module
LISIHRQEKSKRTPAGISVVSGRLQPAQWIVHRMSDHDEAGGVSFEVTLAPGEVIEGVILADHLKSVDWRARRAEHAGTVAAGVLRDVIARIAPLLGLL